MSPEESALLVREVVAGLFDAGGFTAVFDRPDMANLAVNGIEAYGELVTGEIVPLGRIAASRTRSCRTGPASADDAIADVEVSSTRRIRWCRRSCRTACGSRRRWRCPTALSVSIRRAVINDVTLDELVRLGTITLRRPTSSRRWCGRS